MTGCAISTEIDLTLIYRLIVRKQRNKVVSISIERIKGQKEKLPLYRNLNELAEELVRLMPADKIDVRKSFFLWQ